MPPSLETEAAPPGRLGAWTPSRLRIPRGTFHYEAHFGAHEPACMGHALLAHIGTWPSCLFRNGPLARPIPPGMRADDRERIERERDSPKSMAVATALMIIAPTTAWLAYIRPVVGAHGSLASLVITLFLAALSLGFLVAAWFVEPGILHVSSRVPDRSDIDPNTGRPREIWYIDDRVTGKQHNLIEFRAKFFRETGNCIENYDHFCPWVGNAVGVRNYRDFVGFVFSAALLSGFVMSSCVRGLIDHMIEGKQGVLELGGSPVLGPVMCIVLLLYCAVVFFATLGLLVYHLALIAKNQTTNEDLKKVYQNVRAT